MNRCMQKCRSWFGWSALVLLAAPGAVRAQGNDIAIVHRLLLDGRLIVTPAGAAPQQAQLGRRLQNRDHVVTSDNTRAAIRFTDDGSLLRLNPNSQLTITAEGDRTSAVKTLELEFGELWLRVSRKDAQNVRVQTPAGVAAVKGTEFVVSVDAAGVTTILTLEGLVEFFNTGGRADIGEGRTAVVTSATEAPVARDATREQLEAAQGSGEPEIAGDRTLIEVPMQDVDGRTRTILIEVPRAALRALPGGGR